MFERFEISYPYTGTLRPMVGGEALRTKEVFGHFRKMPEKGEPFIMVAEALEGGVGRMITTSPIQDVLTEGSVMVIETENSTYEVTMEEKVNG